jgi:misacylated tRNA(Ala) deacylase
LNADSPPPTARLYWHDDYCFETAARVSAVRGRALAFDQTCFYPGGGGQPPDTGRLRTASGVVLEIETVGAGTEEVLWHHTGATPAADLPGQLVQLAVDRGRRLAHTRYHTALHVLNTLARREYDGWITGAQITADYARIDFKLERVSPALAGDLEAKVNAVLEEGRALSARFLPEAEFNQRPDLRRTLTAEVPVYHSQVRVVAIDGFDAQACGGTHVHSTAEVGRCAIFRIENKGRQNKRLYLRLAAPSAL